jgi:hypothetical protein
MWRARAELSAGDPARARAFDRAVLVGWAALGEFAGYERAADVTLAEIAVELGPEAAGAAEAIFRDQAVLGCGARVVDGAQGVAEWTLPEPAEPGAVQPGPFQLRYQIAREADALVVEVAAFEAPGLGGFVGASAVSALVKPGGDPIEWREDTAGDLISDATAEAPLEIAADRSARAVLPGPFSPGPYHLMLVNRGPPAGVRGVRVVSDDDDGGCGCAAGARGGGGGAASGWLVAIAIIASIAGGRRSGRRAAHASTAKCMEGTGKADGMRCAAAPRDDPRSIHPVRFGPPRPGGRRG